MATEMATGASAGRAKRSSVLRTAVQLVAMPVMKHDGQQRIEEADGEGELGGRKVRGDEREEAVRGERHQQRRGAEQQAHPEHGAGEQLLGAVAALLFPHPDERGHERLVHRFGDEVDEQAGDERGGEKCVHGVGAAIDGGDGDLFAGGDELDEDASGAYREGGAEDAAVDGRGPGAESGIWDAALINLRSIGGNGVKRRDA